MFSPELLIPQIHYGKRGKIRKKEEKKKRKIKPGASKLILPKQFGGQTFPQMKTAVHLLISLKLFHVIFISF